MGKALLALKPDGEVRETLDNCLDARTTETLGSIDGLLSELAITRLRGYAVSNQELFEGVKSVSVAFKDPHKHMAVAISVSYPLFVVQNTSDQPIIDALLMFASSFGSRVGDLRWMR
ncbi:IclR family transcriptional regulator [Nitratireductor aquibiodomus RA22]|uniref:IclR family transcriptional regulator n=1 Tax=Nitratireductor aquibiodomus RA22 TaxID=1189611 RepID=I5BSV0_9HYPH|nr:IclR family transcriptional regulator C-terminal domain-containing protein [Nitratireductor aquibiodomus]EIM72652.1 IclR family transcriptional regulator [Nitratireductor aquibiodomus RA22]